MQWPYDKTGHFPKVGPCGCPLMQSMENREERDEREVSATAFAVLPAGGLGGARETSHAHPMRFPTADPMGAEVAG